MRKSMLIKICLNFMYVYYIIYQIKKFYYTTYAI